MQIKTRALVLSWIPYRETSLIARLFTEELGPQSYLVNGVRKAKAPIGMALFQPLTQLDLVVYHRPGQDLNRIKEIRCSGAYQHLPYEIRKTTLGLFLAEVMSRSLKTEERLPNLFEWLQTALHLLDMQPKGLENYLLAFLSGLSYYLGFGPGSADAFLEEVIAYAGPSARHSEEAAELAALDLFLHQGFAAQPGLGLEPRRRMLHHWLLYYQAHGIDMLNSPSLGVLREVLEG